MTGYRNIARLIAASFLLLLTSCTSLDYIAVTAGGSTGGGSAGAPPVREIGKPANNSTVRLDPGTYRGGITISANKVTLIGAGAGRTLIDGDINITGNSCTVSGAHIRGNVNVSGNNADLTGARIDGRVQSSGNNNSW